MSVSVRNHLQRPGAARVKTACQFCVGFSSQGICPKAICILCLSFWLTERTVLVGTLHFEECKRSMFSFSPFPHCCSPQCPLISGTQVPPQASTPGYPLADFNHFLTLEGGTYSPYTLPLLLVTSALVSVCMDLLIWDILCRRNHEICDLLCLASFIEHVFKVHPSCSIYL